MRTALFFAVSGSAAALRAQPLERGATVGGVNLTGLDFLESESACPPEGKCGDGPCQEPREAKTRVRSLAENFHGPGLNFAAVSHAVCILPNDIRTNSIITEPLEAAQRIYKCWSWWRRNPKAVPVLIDDTAKLILREHQSKWVKGLLEPLHEMGVQMPVNPSEQLRAVGVSPTIHPGSDGKEAQFFMNEDNARELRDRILALYHGEALPKLRNKTYLALSRDLRTQPRIGFLQRKLHRKSMTTRRLQGEARILSALSQLGPVDQGVFEDMSFHEQVEFMNSHDVVVSPHGNQLAGIPFLPDCASVVEIFPKGYFVPGLFGSMAKNSGLDYRAIYTHSGDPVKEGSPLGAATLNFDRTRDVSHICASVSHVVGAVQDLMAKRSACLAARSA